MLRLVTLVVASLLAMELVVWLAAVVDARDAGAEVPDGSTIAAGIAVAVLYTLGGLVVLGRPAPAALLFVLAAGLAFLFGREYEAERLSVYGLFALLLAAASGVCARWRQVPWLTNGRGD
jgi:hypothetical protein